MTNPPFCDPSASMHAHGAEIRRAIDAVIRSSRYILGPEVEAFEREFAEYLGAGHCVGVASGTDAITLALRALGVKEGDEVICPALTAHGTAIGIQRAGAIPVFADIARSSRCLDPGAVESRIGPRTAAIVAVHLHGHPAPVDELRGIASRHRLCLIEDAAQAHGACGVSGRRLGSYGDAAAFSFYPTKNLGCLGDGGAVVTPDPAVAERLRRLRAYGWDRERVSTVAGLNSRLDEIQAAVLRVLLRDLDASNRRRRALADRYRRAFERAPLALPPASEGAVYHQFAVLTEDRGGFREWLRSGGVGSDVHYPLGLHRMPAFPAADLPVTDEVADRIVSLPIQPEIAEPGAARIMERVLSYPPGT